MWRRLVGRAHPDAGGTHELFIWTVATRDAICGGELGGEIPNASRSREASTPSTDGRVPFDEDAYLEVLSDRAVTMAAMRGDELAYLEALRAYCKAGRDEALRRRRGAAGVCVSYVKKESMSAMDVHKKGARWT
jgi:hypothetical protein